MTTTTKNKHTPGPWTNDCFAVKSPDGTQIFHTGFGLLPPHRSGEAEANARLIAAAPDLLVVCQRVMQLQISASNDEIFTELRAAITKATT